MKNKITKYISGVMLIIMLFGIVAISPNKADASTTKKATTSKVSNTKKSTPLRSNSSAGQAKKVVKKATTKKKVTKKVVKKKHKLVLNSPLIDPRNPPSSPKRR